MSRKSWQRLTRLLHSDDQLDAAEAAISRTNDLLPDKGEEYRFCQCYRVLGDIYCSKGETERAINYFETVLRVITSPSWHGQLYFNHYSLAWLFFFGEKRFDDAHAHIERVKSHATHDPYKLGDAMLLAEFWYEECKFAKAKPEALCAADVYERVGASEDVEACRAILREIDEATKQSAASR